MGFEEVREQCEDTVLLRALTGIGHVWRQRIEVTIIVQTALAGIARSMNSTPGSIR